MYRQKAQPCGGRALPGGDATDAGVGAAGACPGAGRDKRVVSRAPKAGRATGRLERVGAPRQADGAASLPPTTVNKKAGPRARMARVPVGIAAVGADREGVVAAFTGFVFRHGGNIESLSQNVVKGVFGMYIEATFKGGIDGLEPALRRVGRRYGMDVSVHVGGARRKSVAVFVTREPHCLRALLAARGRIAGDISVVVGTERALEPMAKRAGVPFVAVEERDQATAEERLIGVCREYGIDLIVLARYMRILNPNFVWRYPNRIINIHPSLLPAFPGAMAYAQAYERGTKIAGVTSHYVTENLDQGPIILQDSFAVDPDDGLDKVKRRGQGLEARTLVKAVGLHLDDRLDVRWRKVHVRPARGGGGAR